MTDLPLIVASLLFSAWGFYGGTAFRRGRLRRMAQGYFDRTQPAYVRNLPFFLYPGGLLFGLSAIVMTVAPMGGMWAEVVTAVAVFGVMGSIVLTMVWVSRPPEFLKPQWLREREAQGRMP